MNPIKKYRNEYKLEQKALASLANVSVGVVRKCEAGVYPELGPSLAKALATLTGNSTMFIYEEYEQWVFEELNKVYLCDRPFDTPENFKLFRQITCEVNDVHNTIIGFCTLFKIHPYVIEKYEKGRMKEVPKQLVERVNYLRSLQ